MGYSLRSLNFKRNRLLNLLNLLVCFSLSGKYYAQEKIKYNVGVNLYQNIAQNPFTGLGISISANFNAFKLSSGLLVENNLFENNSILLQNGLSINFLKSPKKFNFGLGMNVNFVLTSKTNHSAWINDDQSVLSSFTNSKIINYYESYLLTEAGFTGVAYTNPFSEYSRIDKYKGQITTHIQFSYAFEKVLLKLITGFRWSYFDTRNYYYHYTGYTSLTIKELDFDKNYYIKRAITRSPYIEFQLLFPLRFSKENNK